MSSFKTKKCDKHGEYESKTFTIGKPGSSFYKEMESTCPICTKEQDDTRIKDEISGFKSFRDKEIEQAIIEAKIPLRYKSLRFDTMDPINEAQAEIIKRCENYLIKFNDLKKLGTSIVFTGKPGTGKTHIALSMVIEIIYNKYNELCNESIAKCKEGNSEPFYTSHRSACLYVNTYDLFAEIKATYNKNSEETEIDIIKKYSCVDVLVVDEVGAQSGSDYETNIMFRVINARYEDMKPTFIISNLSEKDLSEYIGERTIDRFYENHGAVFIFDWESVRRK